MNKSIYLFSISSHPDAIHINPLKITFFKPTIKFNNYDYLIITSKQISEALRAYDVKEYSAHKALCISKQSAKSYESLGGEVLEVGAGYGDTLVDTIIKYPKATKWLYLRAEVVASDFVSKCASDGYNIDEVIMYKSECSGELKNLNIEDDATLIFTSPSSVKCFLNHNNINRHAKIIVIGKTTAKALPDGIKYQISDFTTIDSCFKLI